jgi:DNA (cytosine-5)-methyltransferase 1
LFAGWGGFSVGAEAAGADVVYAANHWQLAVEAHAFNHPSTRHECQDLRQADWTALPEYDVLLASPACQGHSQASQPKRRGYHDALRATAWSVVDCAEVTEPEAIIVENVPDFSRWRLYEGWCDQLRKLGYELSEHRLVASHFGVPQRRDRLFIVGAKGRKLQLRGLGGGVEPGFGPSIDWHAPGNWRRVDDASLAVQGRIAKGRRNHGRTFLTQHVTGHPGVGLDEPIRTITTKDQWAVVDGGRYRPLTVRETARAMGFPEHYGWPSHATRKNAIRGLGNAVCPPVATRLVGALAAALDMPVRIAA